AVHARRLEAPRRPPAGVAELVDSFFDRMLWLEPYIAASFLFVAGFSLVLSQKHGKARGARPFVAKIARRALGLWALSVVLFVPQYGLALPDLIVSSGILSA